MENQKNEIENEIGKIDPFFKDTYAKIKRIEDKALDDLFKNNNPSPKMIPILDLFLEVWKIKIIKVN